MVSRTSPGLFGRIEKVVSGIGDAKLVIDMLGVAAGGGEFASLGVDALDGRGARKDAVSFMTYDVDKQPGNGIGIGRRCIGDGFAEDPAAVGGFPGRSGEMLAKELAVFVEKLSVGCLQCPGEVWTIAFTGVNLIALGVDLHEELFAGGRLELLRDLLWGGDGKKCARPEEKYDGSEYANGIRHGASPPVGDGLRLQRKEYNATREAKYLRLLAATR